MEKFWTQFYPESVPAELPPSPYTSLNDFFDDKLSAFAKMPLSENMGVTLSYEQVNNYAKQLAAWLQSIGLPRGSTVALMMPNLHQYLPLLIGVIRAGYVLTTVNPLYTARELKHQLNDADAKVILILENFCHTLDQVVDETALQHIVVSKIGDMLGTVKGTVVNLAAKYVKKVIPDYHFSSQASYQIYQLPKVLALGKQLSYLPHKAGTDDLVFLQYTGGTTGVSKGLLITHKNVLTAINQFQTWFNPALEKVSDNNQLTNIVALPLYHIFAFIMSMLSMQMGQKMILVTNPRDIPGFIKILAQQPFHIFPAVNTLYQALLNHPDFVRVDCSHLVVSMAGGMAATPSTAQKWLEVTGCPMIEGWGMSETLGGGTANIVTNKAFTGTIGLPLPGIDISIRDDNDKELGIDEVGEICIKGDNVIQGYHRIDNHAYFTEDGYLKTGDIGLINPQGQIKLLDRKKDMLIVSGFNVYPTEIESVLLQHDMVAECGVIGIDDELQGQTVKAFIVKADPSLTIDMLKAFSQKNLAGYKCPRQFEFIDQLPKTAVGKIQKNELRGQK